MGFRTPSTRALPGRDGGAPVPAFAPRGPAPHGKEPPMTRNPLRLLLICSLLAFTFVVAACGSDDNNDKSSTSSSSTTPSVEGKKGGILRQLGASDVDFIDPGRTYYTGGYQLAYPTQRPLYSFKPGQV